MLGLLLCVFVIGVFVCILFCMVVWIYVGVLVWRDWFSVFDSFVIVSGIFYCNNDNLISIIFLVVLLRV